MRESEFQRALIDVATMRGWRVMHNSDSRKMVKRGSGYAPVADPLAAGWPDLFLAKPGCPMRVFELKSAVGRLTDNQRSWLDLLTISGMPCYVLRPDALERPRLWLARELPDECRWNLGSPS